MGQTKPLGIDPSIRNCGVSSGKDTIVIHTEPSDLQTGSQNNQRRCQEIIAKIVAFINVNYDPDDVLMVVLEGMSLSPGSNHLAEMGWLFCEIYNRLPSMTTRPLTICEIPPSTLKKFVTGKGNAPKEDMKRFVKEKWGVEFELDRGGDKVDAYALYKYGVAILEGEIEFVPTKRRGRGAKTVQQRTAKARKNAKEKE